MKKLVLTPLHAVSNSDIVTTTACKLCTRWVFRPFTNQLQDIWSSTRVYTWCHQTEGHHHTRSASFAWTGALIDLCRSTRVLRCQCPYHTQPFLTCSRLVQLFRWMFSSVHVNRKLWCPFYWDFLTGIVSIMTISPNFIYRDTNWCKKTMRRGRAIGLKHNHTGHNIILNCSDVIKVWSALTVLGSYNGCLCVFHVEQVYTSTCTYASACIIT